MRGFISGLVLAALAPAALTTAAIAQSPQDQARWDAAQARYNSETQRYYAERDRYFASRDAWSRRSGYAPRSSGRDYGYNDPYATDYDASRYYRDGPGYQERTLSANDQVYQGSDGRYYCRRSDGTTGLIIGGAVGGLFGNVVDGGRHRAGGTLLGAAVGALLGKSAEQSNQQLRCR